MDRSAIVVPTRGKSDHSLFAKPLFDLIDRFQRFDCDGNSRLQAKANGEVDEFRKIVVIHRNGEVDIHRHAAHAIQKDRKTAYENVIDIGALVACENF